MGKLSLHARTEIVLAAALFLGSCSGNGPSYRFSDAERDEIGDVAGDVAHDIVLEHEKIQELETRLTEVEDQLGI